MRLQGITPGVSKTQWSVLQNVPQWYACTSVKQNGGSMCTVDKNKAAVELYEQYAVKSFFAWVRDTANEDVPEWATHSLFGKTNLNSKYT